MTRLQDTGRVDIDARRILNEQAELGQTLACTSPTDRQALTFRSS